MITCLTISDFNVSNFNAYLINSEERPKFRVIEVPFGQVQHLLMDETASCWEEVPDTVIVWTQPQAIAQTMRHALMFEEVQADDLLEEVDQFADLLLSIGGRTKTILVPNWVLPSSLPYFLCSFSPVVLTKSPVGVALLKEGYKQSTAP